MQLGRRGDHHRLRRLARHHLIEITIDRRGDILTQHINHEPRPVTGHTVHFGVRIHHREMRQPHLAQANNGQLQILFRHAPNQLLLRENTRK